MPDRRVRELRLREGKTQKEIADYLNISRSTYTLYESARRQMSNETLCALAEYYGVSTDYLLERTDNPAPAGAFTPKEIELIRQYRSLDERGRRSVEGALRFEQEWSYRQQK
ncbi:MAG TPA: helix-turn-helix transcriptional regulator [Candidatus Fimivicinus intestinavium]|nr:helix-turn-helix transcriptional regulator [Candidatus Fimivicinus intestinavium]